MCHSSTVLAKVRITWHFLHRLKDLHSNNLRKCGAIQVDVFRVTASRSYQSHHYKKHSL